MIFEMQIPGALQRSGEAVPSISVLLMLQHLTFILASLLFPLCYLEQIQSKVAFL